VAETAGPIRRSPVTSRRRGAGRWRDGWSSALRVRRTAQRRSGPAVSPRSCRPAAGPHHGPDPDSGPETLRVGVPAAGQARITPVPGVIRATPPGVVQ